jgi:hypothetical protein
MSDFVTEYRLEYADSRHGDANLRAKPLDRPAQNSNIPGVKVKVGARHIKFKDSTGWEQQVAVRMGALQAGLGTCNIDN